MSLEEVVRAVSALHDSHSSHDQRQAADEFLRNWQETLEAWQLSDQILQAPDLPPEVHHLAATTLRFKIMYDFVELPEASHESLCQSLLDHIERFKFASPSSVVRFLILALADLSVHTALTWRAPVDTIVDRFNHPTLDSLTLVMCLAALPEENANRRVMVDPEVRSHHTALLRNKANEVLKRLEDIKSYAAAANQSETFVKVLQCYVEWMPLTLYCPTSTAEGTILRDSFDLVHLDTLRAIATGSSSPAAAATSAAVSSADGPVASGNNASIAQKTKLFAESIGGEKLASDLSLAAIDCLCEVFRLCRRSATAHADLFETAAQELSGPVQAYALTAIEQQDWPTCLALARLYEYACEGLTGPLCEHLHDNENLQKIIQVVFVFTSVGFSAGVQELGEQGIAAQIFGFWYDFLEASKKHHEGVTLSASSPASPSPEVASPSVQSPSAQFNGAISDASKGECVNTWAVNPAAPQCNVEVVVRLLEVLLKACQWPVDLLEETQVSCWGDLVEFENFREDAMSLIFETRNVLTFEGLLQRILVSFSHVSQNATSSKLAEEAHLKVLSTLLRKWNETVPMEGACGGLLDFLSTLLDASPPANVITTYARTAAVQLIGQCAAHKWLRTRPNAIKATLEGLISQVGQQPSSDVTGQASQGFLEECRHRLGNYAADAVSTVCQFNADLPEMHVLVDDLIEAVHKQIHSRVDEAANNFMLQAVGFVVSELPEDAKFLQAVERLCNPIIQSIVSCAPGVPGGAGELAVEYRSIHVWYGGLPTTSQTSRWVDRLAVVMKSLGPLSSQARRDLFGTFTVDCLWPMMEGLLRTRQDCKVLVERIDRVLKHGMRCSPDKFFAVVPAFCTLLVENARVKLWATYLYAAEWLAVQYGKIPTAQSYLATLFEELTTIGLKYVNDLYSSGDPTDGHELLEDFYSMMSRFLRSCPIIVCASPNLEAALDASYKVLYHEHEGVCSAVYGFIESSCHLASGETRTNDRDHQKYQQMVNLEICPLFMKHLLPLLCEFMRVVMSVPHSIVLEKLRDVLEAIVCDWPAADVSPLLDEALKILPTKVIPSDTMRARLLGDIVLGDRRSLENAVDELSYRCKQVLMRTRQETGSKAVKELAVGAGA